MTFEIGKISLVEGIGKIEVSVRIRESDKQSAQQSAAITVYLDNKNQTVSELKVEAEKAAKDFLSKAIE